MTAQPLVTAIVANWNGAKDLEVCLPSLTAQTYSPLEILVADNASSDESESVAKSCGAKWLGLDRNYGLAGALNRGAKAAQGEYVLFLNNDMRFSADFVERMADTMSRDSTIFSVDAMQFDWNGERKVHLATSLATARSGEFDDELAPGLFLHQFETAAARPVLMSSAANMFARKTYFEMLGGYDERLPVGAEDTELCWRAWLRGWKTMFEPNAICWHRVGQSTRSTEGSRFRFRGTLTGRLFISTKLLPASYLMRVWANSIGGLAKDALRLKGSRVRDRLEVLTKYIGQMPRLSRERREIYRAAGITPGKQIERLKRIGDT